MHFSDFFVCAILGDKRIDNRYFKIVIVEIVEEWVMIKTCGFQKDVDFQGMQVCCFFKTYK